MMNTRQATLRWNGSNTLVWQTVTFKLSAIVVHTSIEIKS